MILDERANLQMKSYLPNEKSNISNEKWIFLVAALLPLSQVVEFSIVGQLYLHDILSFFIVIIGFLTLKDPLSFLKPLSLFLLLTIIWLIGAVASDIWVGSSSDDIGRGWSKIALFAIHGLAIWIISRGRLNILAIYMVGTGFSYIIKATLFPNELAELDPWKFGIGVGLLLISTGLIFIGSGKNKLLKYFSYALTFFVLIGSLIFNYRSLFAVIFISLLYLQLSVATGNLKRFDRVLNRLSFSIFVIFGFFVIQLFIIVYGQLAFSGNLGEDARAKYVMQTQADTNLLVGGRPEFLVSTQAILDSPVVGHGSWARDRYYANMYFSELMRRGLIEDAQWRDLDEKRNDLIPSHSHLAGAWVESGILGVPIWLYIIYMSFEVLFSAMKYRYIPSLFVVTTAFLVLWDVLFSPFAANGRILKAAQVCILISVTASIAGRARSGAKSQVKHEV